MASANIARRCYQSKIARMVSKTARAVAGGALLIGLCACAAAPTPPALSTPAPLPVPTPTPAVALQVEASPSPSPLPAADASVKNFAPAQRSVWNTTIGQDQMRGTCAKGSVLPAYGLVQITPGENGLEWKNQEPKPYPMQRLDVNRYQFAGPNSINDGVVTMTLTFVDDKNLSMLREFIADKEPDCTHTHEYTGVFQWFR